MNWKREAEQALRDYPARSRAVVSIPDAIAMLEDKFHAIRSPKMDGGARGEHTVEDAWIENIMRRDKLAQALSIASAEVERTVRGLEELSEQERHILDLFYMHRTQESVDRLMEELHLERSQVYERKDRALRHFTLAMYGCIEP